MNRALLRAQLIRHEGLRLLPYLDTVGKVTIGYGRNLTDKGIDRYEADLMLTHDMAVVEAALSELPWWMALDDVRQRVCADMAFNLGVLGFLAFHDTIGHIRRGEYAEAAIAMIDSLWSRQVGQRAETLARMMRTGRDG